MSNVVFFVFCFKSDHLDSFKLRILFNQKNKRGKIARIVSVRYWLKTKEKKLQKGWEEFWYMHRPTISIFYFWYYGRCFFWLLNDKPEMQIMQKLYGNVILLCSKIWLFSAFYVFVHYRNLFPFHYPPIRFFIIYPKHIIIVYCFVHDLVTL